VSLAPSTLHLPVYQSFEKITTKYAKLKEKKNSYFIEEKEKNCPSFTCLSIIRENQTKLRCVKFPRKKKFISYSKNI